MTEPKKKSVGMVIDNSKGGVVKGNKVYGHHDIGMQLTNNDGTEVSDNVVEDLQQAEKPQAIKKLKKLKGSKDYFRIKLGDYRIGLKFENDTVSFVRFLHRREIYRFFP